MKRNERKNHDFHITDVPGEKKIDEIFKIKKEKIFYKQKTMKTNNIAN